MKRFLIGAIAALISFGACATTYTPLSLIALQAGNTVVANVTGASASPTAFSMPSCSTSVSALNWTSGTGFTCNTGLITATTVSSIYLTQASAASTYLTTSTAAATYAPVAGVTSGACAPAGNVGECKNSNVPLGSAVSLPSTPAYTNITSVSLTAGNWLCSGSVGFLPNTTTVQTNQQATISTTSGSGSGNVSGAVMVLASAGVTGSAGTNVLPTGVGMVNVTTTTPVYLEAYGAFTASTNSAYGYINCIRWH